MYKRRSPSESNYQIRAPVGTTSVEEQTTTGCTQPTFKIYASTKSVDENSMETYHGAVSAYLLVGPSRAKICSYAIEPNAAAPAACNGMQTIDLPQKSPSWEAYNATSNATASLPLTLTSYVNSTTGNVYSLRRGLSLDTYPPSTTLLPRLSG